MVLDPQWIHTKIQIELVPELVRQKCHAIDYIWDYQDTHPHKISSLEFPGICSIRVRFQMRDLPLLLIHMVLAHPITTLTYTFNMLQMVRQMPIQQQLQQLFASPQQQFMSLVCCDHGVRNSQTYALVTRVQNTSQLF